MVKRLLAVFLLLPSLALAAPPRLAVTWGTTPSGIIVDVLIDHAQVPILPDACTAAVGGVCRVVGFNLAPGSSHTITVRALDSATGLRSVESNALQAQVPLQPTPTNTPRPTNTPTAPNAPTLINVAPLP